MLFIRVLILFILVMNLFNFLEFFVLGLVMLMFVVGNYVYLFLELGCIGNFFGN